MRRLPSRGEAKIRMWLFVNNIRFEMEKEFPDLINPRTGANLKLDFWLPDHNMAIEYDGGHHLTANNHYHDGCKKSFKSQLARDHIKDKWCKNKDFTMLRIKCNEDTQIYRTLKRALVKDEKELTSLWVGV